MFLHWNVFQISVRTSNQRSSCDKCLDVRLQNYAWFCQVSIYVWHLVDIYKHRVKLFSFGSCCLYIFFLIFFYQTSEHCLQYFWKFQITKVYFLEVVNFPIVIFVFLGSALTLDDERRQISNLICGFVRKVSFGRDFEQQLSFYVEARSSFTNLDSVLVQLVQVSSVNTVICIPMWHHYTNIGSTSCSSKNMDVMNRIVDMKTLLFCYFSLCMFF